MKNLFVLFILLAGLLTAQTSVEEKSGAVLVSYQNAFTLSSASTVYSDAIDLYSGGKYLMPTDSLDFIPISWSVTDTCVVTLSIEGRKASAGRNSAWTALATVVTSYSGAGNDSLYTRLLMPVGTIAATSLSGRAISLAAFQPDQIRVKAVFTNKTTVGNGGNLKVWFTFRK